MDVEATRRAYADLLALIQQKPGQESYTFEFPNATAEQAEALRKAGQYVVMNLGVGVTITIAGVRYKE
jgi:hypothetical protein